jgi:PTH1 family peptidyl-tRNA hydrolase
MNTPPPAPETGAIGISLIVGLGNPGRRYANTRHNIGFMVVDWLAVHLAAPVWRAERRAEVTRCRLEGKDLVLAKPQTFMNASGEAVQGLAAWYHLPPAAILVITDDLDLPFGRLRLRPGGSAGGHNGLKSIIAHLGTADFPRLRLGIGRPEAGETIDWVLSPFDRDAEQDLPRLCAIAGTMVLDAVTLGVHAAMNRYNGRGDVLGRAAADNAPRQAQQSGSTE